MDSEIHLLERKIKFLLSQYKQAKLEINNLQKENEELRFVIKRKDKQINDFQNKIKISKIVDSMNREENQLPELRKIIDEYIKEIDKCIIHMSK